MTEPRYDVIAIGNAIVDVMAPCEEDLIAELDAVVAHLYGLDAEDLEVIWDTFHPTVDHLPPLDKVLGFHENWDR